MKKLAALFAVALLASGCVVEFGNASGYDYVTYESHCDEASVDYYYTEVDCPEVVYEFVLCDPYGEIYRDECLTSPPREMFLSHCYTTHFCYTYDQGQL